MKTLAYKTYLDKVYGCFLGKTVIGTLGAPFEGVKMPLELPFLPEMVDSMLPNDDLDLQILWFDVVKKTKANIKYIDLTDDLFVTLENVKKAISENTKVISLAHITNVLGDVRPLKEIIDYAHKNNILVVIDAAQSIPHQKINWMMVESPHRLTRPIFYKNN